MNVKNSNKNQKLIIQVVVGYMYKVMKNGKDTTPFREEFAAIRHGDYKKFLDLIGKPIDYIIIGDINKPGVYSTNTEIENDDIDFIRLVKSAQSLKEFYRNCIKTYGNIKDLDIPDSIFEYVTLFELSLRIHRNNRSSRTDRITLEYVINEMKELINLTNQETNILHLITER